MSGSFQLPSDTTGKGSRDTTKSQEEVTASPMGANGQRAAVVTDGSRIRLVRGPFPDVAFFRCHAVVHSRVVLLSVNLLYSGRRLRETLWESEFDLL